MFDGHPNLPPEQYAFVSLGANLPSGTGNPADTIREAFDRLRRINAESFLASSLWTSEPIDCPPGSPPYVNAVAGIVPPAGQAPLDFLHELQTLEQEFGRRRSGLRNEPRPLDLDLITFRGMLCATDELTLPHPRAAQRRFVLEPLREIAGSSFVMPGMGKTVGDLLQDVEDQPLLRIDD